MLDQSFQANEARVAVADSVKNFLHVETSCLFDKQSETFPRCFKVIHIEI